MSLDDVWMNLATVTQKVSHAARHHPSVKRVILLPLWTPAGANVVPSSPADTCGPARCASSMVSLVSGPERSLPTLGGGPDIDNHNGESATNATRLMSRARSANTRLSATSSFFDVRAAILVRNRNCRLDPALRCKVQIRRHVEKHSSPHHLGFCGLRFHRHFRVLHSVDCPLGG